MQRQKYNLCKYTVNIQQSCTDQYFLILRTKIMMCNVKGVSHDDMVILFAKQETKKESKYWT